MSPRHTFNSLVAALLMSVAAFGQMTAPADAFANVRILLKQANYAAAASLLDGLSIGALSQQEQFEAGWLYGQARQFDKALKVFGGVPESVPDRVSHRYAVALCELQLGQYHAAIEALQPVMDEPGFKSRQANVLGVAYSKAGMPEKALATFRLAIEKDPRDPAAYFNTITALCERGQLQECLAWAARTAETFPESVEAHIVYGAAYLETGHSAEGEREFAAARARDRHSAEAAFFLALAEYRANEFAKAADTLRSAIQEKADDSDVHYLLAECILREAPEKLEAPLAELDAALAMNPQSAPALTARGQLRLKCKRYELAAEDSRRALENDARSRTALYTLARAYQALGKTEEARQTRARLSGTRGDEGDAIGDARLNAAIAGESGGGHE